MGTQKGDSQRPMANSKKIEARKEQILKAAEKVFAEKGFQEATIAEIAKLAKISEASIYEYFTTKEGLLFAIPVEAASRLFETMEFHLKIIRGSANKLRAFIYLLLYAYRENPDFTAILMLILKHNKRFLETEGHLVIREGIRNINTIVEEGVASGEFKVGTDPYLVRAMIIGTIEHRVTSWLMTGKPDDIMELVDPLIDTIVQGIKPRNEEASCFAIKMIPTAEKEV